MMLISLMRIDAGAPRLRYMRYVNIALYHENIMLRHAIIYAIIVSLSSLVVDYHILRIGVADFSHYLLMVSRHFFVSILIGYAGLPSMIATLIGR